MENSLKKRIASSFTKHAITYDSFAKLQRLSADIIEAEIVKSLSALPMGPILEIGCGSGLLSEKILALLPTRDFDLLDISAGMLDVCKKRVAGQQSEDRAVRYLEEDAENVIVSDRYAMIFSGLTIQWFRNLEKSLKQMIAALLPGGMLVCSFLGKDSFNEWRQQCLNNNVLCTLNDMPDPTTVSAHLADMGHLVSFTEKTVYLSYPSVIDFFISLKKTGTGVNFSGGGNSLTDMKKLIEQWQASSPKNVELTCQVVCFSVAK